MRKILLILLLLFMVAVPLTYIILDFACDQKLNETMLEMCRSFGGTFDLATRTCYIAVYPEVIA